MNFRREGIVPIVWAKTANNLTTSVFGTKTLKRKYCSCPNCWTKEPQVYSNFFRKSGRQHVDPEDIQIGDLEGFCKPCYEHRIETREARKNPIITATLNSFIEETENA